MSQSYVEDKTKLRKDLSKKAVAFAMKSRWKEAASVNRAVLKDFPRDLEAWNRLGKALSELGCVTEACEAFAKALEVSPHNSIARKNFERLKRLGEDEQPALVTSGATAQAFIEEGGNSGVTSLVGLARPNDLLKLSPGHPINLRSEGGGLRVYRSSGDYVGRVESRLASRLARLIKGGNRYDATVRSVSEREVIIIIRETYRHHSQAHVPSFPARVTGPYPMYLSGAPIEYGLSDELGDEEQLSVKDWSNDDTEPGDDAAFTPVIHRIISNPGSDLDGDDDY